MAKKKKKKLKVNIVRNTPKQNQPSNFRKDLVESFKRRRTPESFIYNYHTKAFQHFHDLSARQLRPSNKYRALFWTKIPSGKYDSNQSHRYLKDYKDFIESYLKEIIQKYSITYWLHVSRRIAPNTTGDDHRPETIRICRIILTAAIQKYSKLTQCENIGLSSEVEVADVFNGLFLRPEFAKELKYFLEAPPQLVLTNFDEKNLLEYYELEQLAFEMWLIGSKSRVVAKGANLVIDLNHPKILLDDRSRELEQLIEIYDNRSSKMTASATGTVFDLPKTSTSGNILTIQVFADRSLEAYSDPVTEYLKISFPDGHFPNFEFVPFDVKSFLQVHMEFAKDFFEKWNVRLEYVLSIITGVSISFLNDIVNYKDIVVATNLLYRGYQMYSLEGLKGGIEKNWEVITKYLGLGIPFSEVEVNQAYDFLSLTEFNKHQIFVDSFGPLKVLVPALKSTDVFVDHSVIGDVLYNLFHGLPLKDRKFKGEFLEKALQKQNSYLPTTESKGLDRTSKQVDFSVAKGGVLVLVECKAVARSFGIFSGQAQALEHRLRNVINKGLDDVDKKLAWFLNHPKGTNFDITGFKFLVGIVVSPFTEFIPSTENKYWLNSNLPRVLTIDEFELLMDSDLEKTITKNLIPIV